MPTLTEVIALDATADAPPAERIAVGTPQPADADAVEQAWAALKPWLDGELEQRVHAALDPAWQTLHDALLRRLRGEFEGLLREALQRTLTQSRPQPG